MVVKPFVPPLRVVLRCVQHRIPHILAVVQHRSASLPSLVVNVHDFHFVTGVAAVIARELCWCDHRCEVSVFQQLLVLFQEFFLILRLGVENITAVLNIVDLRLPEDIEQIHPVYGDVSQAVQLFCIPHYLIHGGTCFQFLPNGIGVSLLEIVLPQHHRDNAGQCPGFQLVSLFPGQDVGPGVCFHCVCVLAGDHIMEPCSLCLEAGGRRPAAFLRLLSVCHRGGHIAVSHFPPTFRVFYPGLNAGLAAPVFVQSPAELLECAAVHSIFCV